jgi:hypothetical protein
MPPGAAQVRDTRGFRECLRGRAGEPSARVLLKLGAQWRAEFENEGSELALFPSACRAEGPFSLGARPISDLLRGDSDGAPHRFIFQRQNTEGELPIIEN